MAAGFSAPACWESGPPPRCSIRAELASDRRNIAIAAVASAAATLVNPFGIGLWTFLLQTVRVDRADITDWQPVTYSTDILIVWLVHRRDVRRPAVSRTQNSVFFYRDDAWLAGRRFFSRAAPRIVFRAQRGDASSASAHTGSDGWSFSALVKGHAGFTRSRPRRDWTRLMRDRCCLAFSPSATDRAFQSNSAGNPEPDVTSFVRLNNLRGRMITWFDWGEYAIWHFSPAIQVSLDGRRETAYSANVVRSHLEFYRNQEPPGSTIADLLESGLRLAAEGSAGRQHASRSWRGRQSSRGQFRQS